MVIYLFLFHPFMTVTSEHFSEIIQEKQPDEALCQSHCETSAVAFLGMLQITHWKNETLMLY